MSADYLEIQTKLYMAESKLGFGPDPISRQALRHQADYLANRETLTVAAPARGLQRLRLALSSR